MSQSDFTIETNGVSGTTFGLDIQTALRALASTSLGTSAPSTVYDGQIWLDNASTPWKLKIYDGSDWITLFEVDAGSDTASAVGQSTTPVGTVSMFAGAAADVPEDWLLCDGSAVSRTTYADLYTVLGDLWGNGDGSSTFNLPDYRGKSPLGVNDSGLPAGEDGSFSTRNEAATGGEEDHTLGTSELPAHTHQLDKSGGAMGGAGITTNNTYVGAKFTTNSTGSGSSHNTMHPFIVINFIIKH